MASFSTFKTLEEALLHFGISEKNQNIFPHIQNTHLVSPYLEEEIEFNTTKLPYNISEASICEMVIFPVLKAVWKHFEKNLLLWSHKSIGKESDMSGIPDYILAKRSLLGRVMDLPLLIMIEAKKDDFDGGWGQCVAQMVTAQSINNNQTEIFGIVTNGDTWQFGKLEGRHFTKNKSFISLTELATLYNTLYYLFELCESKITGKEKDS